MGPKPGVPRGTYKSHKLTIKHEFMVCDDCGIGYKKRSSLIQHFNTRHLKKNVRCPQCKKMFSQLSAMKRHQKIHILQTNAGEQSSNCSGNSKKDCPSFLKCLSLKESHVYGTHVIAKEDIVAGQLLHVSYPFACAVVPECIAKKCFECGKNQK